VLKILFESNLKVYFEEGKLNQNIAKKIIFSINNSSQRHSTIYPVCIAAIYLQLFAGSGLGRSPAFLAAPRRVQPSLLRQGAAAVTTPAVDTGVRPGPLAGGLFNAAALPFLGQHPLQYQIPNLASQAGTSLPLAPTRCRPVDGAELECSRIEIDEPESTKNFRMLLES
jgi:hypothetical protein